MTARWSVAWASRRTRRNRCSRAWRSRSAWIWTLGRIGPVSYPRTRLTRPCTNNSFFHGTPRLIILLFKQKQTKKKKRSEIISLLELFSSRVLVPPFADPLGKNRVVYLYNESTLLALSLSLSLFLSFLLWNTFLSNSFSSQDRKRLTILWYVSIPITEFYARFVAATSRISYTRVSTLKLRVLTETDQEKIRIGFQATESFVVR